MGFVSVHSPPIEDITGLLKAKTPMTDNPVSPYELAWGQLSITSKVYLGPRHVTLPL